MADPLLLSAATSWSNRHTALGATVVSRPTGEDCSPLFHACEYKKLVRLARIIASDPATQTREKIRAVEESWHNDLDVGSGCLSLAVHPASGLVWRSSSTPDLPFEDTVEQCEAALCGFRLLVDPKDGRYLCATLPPPEFRVLQRKRLWLAMRCLILLDGNATFLATVGQKAALSDDLDVAQTGERLAIGSLQLKVNLLAAEGAVLAKWLFPTSPLLVPVTKLTVQQRAPSVAWRRG